jgi:hypothetical protein
VWLRQNLCERCGQAKLLVAARHISVEVEHSLRNRKAILGTERPLDHFRHMAYIWLTFRVLVLVVQRTTVHQSS